jgi:hypothetical protein
MKVLTDLSQRESLVLWGKEEHNSANEEWKRVIDEMSQDENEYSWIKEHGQPADAP